MMNSLKWIFQSSVVEDERDLLEQRPHLNIDHMKLDHIEDLNLDPNITYISRVTCEAAKVLSKFKNVIVPNFSLYDCCRYYYHVPHLLNSDHILTKWEFLNEYHFEYFNTENLFIRPVTGDKIFTGTCLGKKWWEKEKVCIENLPFTNIKPDTLILVADGVEVGGEARFLVGPNGVISGSWYADENLTGEYTLENLIPLVNEVPHIFDPFFTVDVGITRRKHEIKFHPRIIEVNSFNCAGLYDINTKQMIQEVEQYYGNQS